MVNPRDIAGERRRRRGRRMVHPRDIAGKKMKKKKVKVTGRQPKRGGGGGGGANTSLFLSV